MLTVRKYSPVDRPAVRSICCQTALMGEPSAVFFKDDEIFADALTGYFTDYEPKSSFVAEDGNKVIGYLMGAKDISRMDRIFAGKLALPLFAKAFTRGVFFCKINAMLMFHLFLSLLKGEFKIHDFSNEYPATLHINIVKGYRAAGIGSRLIAAYFDYLKSEGVKGVHCATMSDEAGQFFRKSGFSLLFQGKRSYFRHILRRDVPLYIYGIRLQ